MNRATDSSILYIFFEISRKIWKFPFIIEENIQKIYSPPASPL